MASSTKKRPPSGAEDLRLDALPAAEDAAGPVEDVEALDGLGEAAAVEREDLRREVAAPVEHREGDGDDDEAERREHDIPRLSLIHI
mgnify:CR=1 FL=1